jgi:excisionase family DNA binding protein
MKAKQTIDADEWKTLDEGAEYVKAHPATLRRAIYRGDLRHARIGNKCIRLRKSWLDAWLEKCATPVEVR